MHDFLRELYGFYVENHAFCVFAVLLAWGSSYFRLLRMRVGYLTLVLKSTGFVLPYSGGTVPDSHRVLSFVFYAGSRIENKELFRAQKLFAENLAKCQKRVKL